MERNQPVVEGKPLLERLVGNVLAIELHGVADCEVEQRRAVGFRHAALAEDELPAGHLLSLQLVGAREDLLELLLDGGADLLRRPRRHLVLCRVVVELRRAVAAPAPPLRVVEVRVREVELEDRLQRRRLRVDGRRQGGEPVGRLLVGEPLHRLLAQQERAGGVGPAPDGDGFALYLRDLVGDGARQVLPARLVNDPPCLAEIVCSHSHSVQRDCRGKRRGPYRDLTSLCSVVAIAHAHPIHFTSISKVPRGRSTSLYTTPAHGFFQA